MSETVIAFRKKVELVDMIDAFSGLRHKIGTLRPVVTTQFAEDFALSSQCQRLVSRVRGPTSTSPSDQSVARLVLPRLARSMVRQLSWFCDAIVSPHFVLSETTVVLMIDSFLQLSPTFCRPHIFQCHEYGCMVWHRRAWDVRRTLLGAAGSHLR